MKTETIMNRSQIFRTAHQTAKATRNNFPSYRAAFSASLKAAYDPIRKITEIRTWSRNGTDFRVYVNFEGVQDQGVYYKDGNAWNAKGKLENMTKEEKAAALAICSKKCGQNAWVTVYKNEINHDHTPKKTRAYSRSYGSFESRELCIHDKWGTLIEID